MPVMRTRESSRTPAVFVSACMLVRPTSGSDAASANVRLAGLRPISLTRTTAYSASVPPERIEVTPQTASPTAMSVTPSPTAATTPAKSWPRVMGSAYLNTLASSPVRSL
eukprot:Amastigsp_a849994_3.p4 type:complete len:110 gc:universal Amastigsp_a849994_3:229-558(+)